MHCVVLPTWALDFYRVTDLGDLPGGVGTITRMAIDDNGQIVGAS